MRELSKIEFAEDLLEFNIDITDSMYEYNGIIVPRVTKILSATLDDSNLISWAGNIMPAVYRNISDGAKRIGTETHHKIENFLNYQMGKSDIEDAEFLNQFLQFNDVEKINRAYNNFKGWYYRLLDWGYKIEEIVGLEISVTCPWYGGTIDGIVKINGCYYIIDFKTSKKISLEHVLQTSAYMWAINNGYARKKMPYIDGIGIIRVDKTTDNTFEDLFYTENNPEQAYYINQFQRCFCSLVDAYYRSKYSEDMFDLYKGCYRFTSVVEGV